MKRGTKVIIFLAILTLLIVPMISAENVSTCRELDQSNTVYILTQDILNHAGTCFTITADNIMLDGNGHRVDGVFTGMGVYSKSQLNITIKNISISDFESEIRFFNTYNSLIKDIIMSRGLFGIYLDSSSNNTIVGIVDRSRGAAITIIRNSNDNNLINIIMTPDSSGHSFFLQSGVKRNNFRNIMDKGRRGLFFQAGADDNFFENMTTNSIFLSDAANNNLFLNTNILGSIRDETRVDQINYIVYNNSFGEIYWTEEGFLRDLSLIGTLELGNTVKIEDNFASLNLSAFSSGKINSSANITLYNIGDRGFINAIILKDGEFECNATTFPTCFNFTPLNANTVIFNISSWSNYSIGVLDSDGDGVSDLLDICPNTELPETFELLPNSLGDIDGDGIFEKLIVKKKNEREVVDSEFTLKDTSGCSCNQILEIKPGKNIGESINGCTKGTIIAFAKHNFSGGILTRFSFVITGFWGDFKDSISGMIIGKLSKL